MCICSVCVCVICSPSYHIIEVCSIWRIWCAAQNHPQFWYFHFHSHSHWLGDDDDASDAVGDVRLRGLQHKDVDVYCRWGRQKEKERAKISVY